MVTKVTEGSLKDEGEEGRATQPSHRYHEDNDNLLSMMLRILGQHTGCTDPTRRTMFSP